MSTTTRRRVRSVGAGLLIAGLVGLLFGVSFPAIAHAASPHGVQIDLGADSPPTRTDP